MYNLYFIWRWINKLGWEMIGNEQLWVRIDAKILLRTGASTNLGNFARYIGMDLLHNRDNYRKIFQQ